MAAIDIDTRKYNMLTFLDNDIDEEEGKSPRDTTTSTSTLPDGVGMDQPPDSVNNKLEPEYNITTTTTNQSGGDAVETDFEPITAKRKIIPNTDLFLKSDDITISPASSMPDLDLDFDDRCSPDDDDTPDCIDNSVFDGDHESWEYSEPSTPVEPIPEYTARQELEDSRNWKVIEIAGKEYRIDMKIIEPYRKVITHGGYYGDGLNAIVVFTACFLPERSHRDYRYVMDNLFLYVISTLELLVVEDYMIVYFHGATSRRKLPGLRWLKRCYDMIDRRLRKNLRGLLVVHPTLIIKTILLMVRPFISSKFSAKMRYVRSLAELPRLVPTEYIFVPDEVKQADLAVNPNVPIPRNQFGNL